MELLIFIIIYFIAIILILKLSKIIAKICSDKNYSIEEIKFVVWFILSILLIFSTLIIILVISYYL